MEKDFLRYLRSSLNTIYDYFLSDTWLYHQTNIRILTKFVLSCAYSYPDVQGKMIINNPIYENTTPKGLWLSSATRLSNIAQEIKGRKRLGFNDQALCHRVQSKIRGLKGTIPDKWIENLPNIPEEVVKIIDDDCRYFDQKTKR